MKHRGERPHHNPRALVVAAIAAGALAATACQPPPPPISSPGATLPAPVVPINCATAPSGSSTASFQPPTLEGNDLDAVALAAAGDAGTLSGLVEITTISDGTPEFDVVPFDEVTDSLADEQDPVLAVDAVQPVTTSGIATSDPLHPNQWSDTLTPYSPAWTCGTGGGVTIAVIDTGVDGTHPDLGGRVAPGGSALAGSAAVTPGNGATDPNGHGTHVAGIAAATADNGTGIAGVAPGATVLPVRVLDGGGSGWSTDVAAGIVWATDLGADVINLSLGSSSQSRSMTNAINYAHASGAVVLAAGGNGGPSGSIHYPAAGPNTIAVASADPTGGISSFSTRGSYLDITAPGSSIVSTLPGGGYGYKSGTSMATPFVSGVVALMVAANPSMNPDQVAARLTATAADSGAPGFDTSFGHGLVQPVGAVTG